jgi:hypothetical protein
MLRAGVSQRDELGVQTLADASEHLKAEILLALLNACDRALARPQGVGKIVLCQALVTSGIPDQGANAAQVVLSHAPTINHM